MKLHELITTLQSIENKNQAVWITTPDHYYANQLPLKTVMETLLLDEQVVLLEFDVEDADEQLQYAIHER